MLFFALFIIELVCLFFLSRLVTQIVSTLLFHLTEDHDTTIHLLSFLFLPGVIVHELSHMFMASLLLVRTGVIEFWPQIHGNRLKLGSVQVAKSDPFRRFLIGAAPLFGGIGLLMLFFVYVSPYFSHPFSWQIFLFLYALFEIGNTMFSSKKDMEGAIFLLIALLLVFGIIFLLGFRLDITQLERLFSLSVTSFFQKLDIIFSLQIAFNTLFYGTVRYILKKKGY